MTAQKEFAAAMANLDGVRPIAGYDDEAFPAGQTGTYNEARKGDAIVIIEPGTTGARAVTATRVLMTAVLSHL